LSFHPPAIPAVDTSLAARLRARIDAQAKPPGALGRLEDLAVQIAALQHSEAPRVARVAAHVFAGDHGMAASGVSAYPSSVTAAMVASFLAGRASVNALARACEVEVKVVDAGVDADLAPHPDLIAAKVRRGSRDASHEAALTPEETTDALQRGVDLARSVKDQGFDALILGEMGIGNTAASALIMHRLAPAPLEACIGSGAGRDPAGLARKAEVLAQAARRTDAQAPLEVLRQFAGLEIAMMAGAVLGGASSRLVVVVDGFISSAAALAAVRMAPEALAYCVFAHASAERGHARLLEAMGAQPLLQLGLRLGEGTGAVLAAPILRAAARMACEVASLDDVLAGRL
jgi:nicotinate-nucleotide--dimethylbenzimidazole phosphoribosyltransferase